MTTMQEDMDAAVALESLMSEAAEQAYEKTPTKAEAQAEYLAALNETNLDKLIELQEQLAGLVDMAVATPIDLDHLGEINPARAQALMEEVLAHKAAEAWLKLRYSLIRAAVFDHITQDNVARKVANPAQAPGELPVPEMGKKFTREGGKAKAEVSKDKLRELLSPEHFAMVYKTVTVPEQIIPAHDEEVFDGAALNALITLKAVSLETIREAIEITGFTPSSFHQRKLDKKD